MGCKVMMFLLAATVAAGAQAVSNPEQPPAADETQSQKSHMPEVQVVQHHDKLRRDRDETMVVFSVFPPSNSQTALPSQHPVFIPSRCS